VAAEVIPLGARLRQHREERGLTQAQAARELDVARTAYRLWELEAARPSPDRWRSIAKWLGLSVTALLLADELIDESEATVARDAAGAVGLTDDAWDEESAASAGDFFSQERMMIDEHTRSGALTAEHAARLRTVIARLQDGAIQHLPRGWHVARLVKRLPMDAVAPAMARAAVVATVIGIPTEALDDAVLLTSELVTNSYVHAESQWVDLAIDVSEQRVRVEVSDQDTRAVRPRAGDLDAGWGFAMLAGIATRWGVERRTDGKTVWFELEPPGSSPRTVTN
jgi:transcriptional regulator with XRE-family HTH domain/anti-sigma regulatory factor (Ser/Thr protein kinase)